MQLGDDGMTSSWLSFPGNPRLGHRCSDKDVTFLRLAALRLGPGPSQRGSDAFLTLGNAPLRAGLLGMVPDVASPLPTCGPDQLTHSVPSPPWNSRDGLATRSACRESQRRLPLSQALPSQEPGARTRPASCLGEGAPRASGCRQDVLGQPHGPDGARDGRGAGGVQGDTEADLREMQLRRRAGGHVAGRLASGLGALQRPAAAPGGLRRSIQSSVAGSWGCFSSWQPEGRCWSLPRPPKDRVGGPVNPRSDHAMAWEG